MNYNNMQLTVCYLALSESLSQVPIQPAIEQNVTCALDIDRTISVRQILQTHKSLLTLHFYGRTVEEVSEHIAVIIPY